MFHVRLCRSRIVAKTERTASGVARTVTYLGKRTKLIDYSPVLNYSAREIYMDNDDDTDLYGDLIKGHTEEGQGHYRAETEEVLWLHAHKLNHSRP